MGKYDIGGYLCIDWDVTDPMFEAVKGHVSDDEFADIVERETGDRPSPPFLRMWARWLFANDGEHDHHIHLYAEKSRGAFPVTVCDLTRTQWVAKRHKEGGVGRLKEVV